jgi:hypothetical protein
VKRSELKRGKPLKRTGRIRPQSAKRRKVNKVRRELANDLLDEPCRIRGPVCTGWAEHFHELVGRAQGGSLTDERNLVPSCDSCNGWIEDNPAVAERNGWKVRSWDAVKGDRGLVPVKPSRIAIASDLEGVS